MFEKLCFFILINVLDTDLRGKSFFRKSQVKSLKTKSLLDFSMTSGLFIKFIMFFSKINLVFDEF
jgi:hypothetical protein